MAFNKVVKAPAKLAHIRNCPRKATERKRQRIEWLLDYAKALLPAIIIHQGRQKLYSYTQFSDVKQELKALGFCDEQLVLLMVREAQRKCKSYFW